METRARTYLKALLWQAIGLVIGGAVGYIYTGSIRLGGSMALVNAGIGLCAYVLYERLWSGVIWGHSPQSRHLPAARRRQVLSHPVEEDFPTQGLE